MAKRICAIIGCGNVGSSIAYTLATVYAGLFEEIILIDINQKRAMAEAEDISHSLPFYAQAKIYSGEYKDLSDAMVVVIAAGAAQRPGEDRRSLLTRNIPIFRDIMESIGKYNDHCTVLVVSNPVDILTYTALYLSGRDRKSIIGSGCVLDTARLKYELGTRIGVDTRNIHMFILGEHGDSEVPIWSGANISGINIDDYCASSEGACPEESFESIFENVRDSAYRIIEGKGATYYGIAGAACRIISAIVRGENTIMPVSVYLQGEYGINGVCLSVPCVVGFGGIKRIIEISLSDEEKERLLKSAKAMEALIESAGLSEAKLAFKDDLFT